MRRAERIKRQINVSAPMGNLVHDSPTGETFRPPEPAENEKVRRKLGAYNTPMWLAEDVVAKTLYPHLLWMAQDPEGWDRAHQRPPVPPPRDRTAVENERASRLADERQGRDDRELRADPHAAHLLTALQAAVPLWIEDLRKLTADQRVALGHELAQVVAYKGDILQFGSKKKGQVAEVFNATARGLAALAFQPGGVTWCGIHWEATE